MNAQTQQIKQNHFIGMNKLIDELKKNELIKEDDKQLNIYFDNWNESDKFKNNYSIRVLSFAVIGAQNRIISFKDFNDILPGIQNINIGRQLARSMKKIKTAGCRCVFVNLNQIKEKEYSYYSLKLSTNDYSTLYSKLREERTAVIGSSKASDSRPEFIEDIDIDAL